MNIKKIKIIGVFGIFIMSFIVHFLYKLIPITIISILAPVNESIWEHMKIIYTSYILYSIIDYLLLKKYNINNFSLQLSLVPLIGIIVYLMIYIPIYNIIGENIIFSIGLLFVIIALEQFINYHLLIYKNIRCGNIISLITIIIIYTVFGYLTYHPIKNYIFFDTKESKYGINIYAK